MDGRIGNGESPFLDNAMMILSLPFPFPPVLVPIVHLSLILHLQRRLRLVRPPELGLRLLVTTRQSKLVRLAGKQFDCRPSYRGPAMYATGLHRQDEIPRICQVQAMKCRATRRARLVQVVPRLCVQQGIAVLGTTLRRIPLS